jgi:hypothetical protein
MQSWLYDINERIKALQAVLDESDDKSIEADVKTALMGVYESDVPKAVEDGIEYIKKQEEAIAGAEAREKQYKEYKEFLKRRLDRVRRGYAEFLIAVDAKKVETPSGRMSVPAPTYSTKVDDMDALPDAYKRKTVDVKPDLIAIKQAIQGGHNVPGAHLEEKQRISIK